MPAGTIVEEGEALKGFGTSSDGATNIPNYIARNISDAEEGEVTRVMNEHNHVTTVVMNHAVERAITLDLVPLAAATIPEIGSQMTYKSQSRAGDQILLVASVGNEEVQNDVVSWPITGFIWDTLTLSTP